MYSDSFEPPWGSKQGTPYAWSILTGLLDSYVGYVGMWDTLGRKQG